MYSLDVGNEISFTLEDVREALQPLGKHGTCLHRLVHLQSFLSQSKFFFYLVAAPVAAELH